MVTVTLERRVQQDIETCSDLTAANHPPELITKLAKRGSSPTVREGVVYHPQLRCGLLSGNRHGLGSLHIARLAADWLESLIAALPYGRATDPSYFGWILNVKLHTPIFSSGWTMVRSSRGISRPETRVGFRPLEVSQKRP
jgi:hypothetical protein